MTRIESSQKSFDLPSEQRKLNFYEVLDVSSDATRLQIRESYIRLKSAFSSTGHVLYSLISEEDARQSLELLDEAYRVLDDEVLRRDYDVKVIGKQIKTPQKSEDYDHHHGFGLPLPNHQEARLGGTLGRPGRYDQEALTADFWSGEPAGFDDRDIDAFSQVEVSAKKKRFSSMAFDEEIKEQIQSHIEKSSQIDGSFFRGLRELLSVSQKEIQDKTKISLQYIKALENDDFKILPPLVYVKGFLKCYLEYLGLDREAPILIKSYTETFQSWRVKKEN